MKKNVRKYYCLKEYNTPKNFIELKPNIPSKPKKEKTFKSKKRKTKRKKKHDLNKKNN